MSEFDPTIPVNGTEADADPIRSNFFQLAIHHAGATAPSSPSQGYVWLDTSNAANHILKIYDDGAWRNLFNHCESTPTPSAGGGGSSLVSTGSGAVSADVAGTYDLREFLLRMTDGVSGLSFDASSRGILASSISSESAITIVSDPNNVITSVDYITSGAYRVLRVVVGAGSGQAQISWTWNNIPFTAAVEAMGEGG